MDSAHRFSSNCCAGMQGVAVTMGLVARASITGGAVLIALCAFNLRSEAASAPSWTGCYIGVQAGVAPSRADWRYTNNSPCSADGNAGPQLGPGAGFYQNRGVVGA